VRRLGLALAVLAAVVPAPPANASLQSQIEAALSAKSLARARVGVLVQDVETSRVLFERGADDLFTTASNTKIVTTAAALHLLGADYTFTTRFLRRGEIAGGVQRGELVVVGGGDPNLSGRFHGGRVAAVFEEVARRLLGEGIRRIDGDVVLDDRMFDREFVAPGWPRDQLDKWYAAPVSALSLNDNCVDVTIRPGPAPGAPAAVSIEPPTRFAVLRNAATTRGARSEHRYVLTRKQGTREIVLSGGVWSGAGLVTESVPVDHPPVFFGTVLRETLERSGIEVRGDVGLCSAREDSDSPGGGAGGALSDGVLVHAVGTPLWVTVEVTNKRSQNFYAEQILKTLGYERRGLGTFEGGVAAVSEFLAEIGIELGSYTMVDGSGLSAQNRFTPRQLVRILEFTTRAPHALAFFRSLPVSGTDGSLEDRLREPAYQGRIVAKTGFIRRASTLSGYARKRSGGTAVFSILMNDFAGSNAEMKEIQDRICRAIIDHAP
jgi:D-alanyl-D-alanine carboxypeptidase/D-alanyl-D-alanine-endopeptidase (penicillin-binding protein 4)